MEIERVKLVEVSKILLGDPWIIKSFSFDGLSGEIEVYLYDSVGNKVVDQEGYAVTAIINVSIR